MTIEIMPYHQHGDTRYRLSESKVDGESVYKCLAAFCDVVITLGIENPEDL